MEKWFYIGDVSIVYGGMFFEVNNDSTVNRVIRITDLDSAAGNDGALLVEDCYPTDLTTEQEENVKSFCGLNDGSEYANSFDKASPETKNVWMAQGAVDYGYADYYPLAVIQTDKYGKNYGSRYHAQDIRFDRSNGNLANFIRKQFLPRGARVVGMPKH